MKLMIIGFARHGKDTVCNMLRDNYKLNFVSSSWFVAEKAVKPYLATVKGITYDNFDAMYADRINHRDEWFSAIADYNKNDPARLGRELFAEYDIYCGNRNVLEFNALKAEKAFDYAFWVDRGLHVEPEPLSSNTLYQSMADYTIDNNADFAHMKRNVERVYTIALKRLHIA